MGIRVNPEALKRQLAIRGCEERAKLPFQAALLRGELPQTIGGGIGQSRMCVYFLRKAHVGEVQASLWPEDVGKVCEATHIQLLSRGRKRRRNRAGGSSFFVQGQGE